MTAEEYINKNRFQNEYEGYNVTEDDALKAVTMAREEEREKALAAYQKMISICQKCTKACSSQCGTDCLTNKFKELLNK